MLDNNFSEFFLYLTVYSMLGWVCEVIYCSVPPKRFINRGFLNGPYCPIYGAGAIMILSAAYPFKQYPLLVFVLSLCAATTLEYFTGWLMEFLFQVRWWDYSERKFNIKGRICLKNSMLFGIMGLTVMYFVHPVVTIVIGYLPGDKQRVLASAIMVVFLVDLLCTLNELLKLTERLKMLQNYLSEIEQYNKEYNWLDKNDLTGSISRLQEICMKHEENTNLANILVRMESMLEKREWRFRLIKSFPQMKPIGFDVALENLCRTWEQRKEQIAERKDTFLQRVERSTKHLRSRTVTVTIGTAESIASRLDAYKLFWIFMTASVLGYVVETIFCLITRGVLESRQGLLYGPFSQVYGLGAVLMVILLAPLSKKSDRWLFCGSALVGGAFEYLCSWVQESIFCTISWEYSGHAFSIGGRTTLTYMFFWGVLGLIYIKGIYPRLSRLITRISKRQGAFSVWVLSTLLIVDIILSGAAVYRWSERNNGIPPSNVYEEFLDERYHNEVIEEIYPNMIKIS